MTQIIFNIKSAVHVVFINLIIITTSFGIYPQIALSAELTLDFTSYSYREVDQNNNFFMEDKSSPFLLTWESEIGGMINQFQKREVLIGCLYIRFSTVLGILTIPLQERVQ